MVNLDVDLEEPSLDMIAIKKTTNKQTHWESAAKKKTNKQKKKISGERFWNCLLLL